MLKTCGENPAKNYHSYLSLYVLRLFESNPKWQDIGKGDGVIGLREIIACIISSDCGSPLS